MVLFALTVLLITLMVTMTLGFSAKAKEKMELQQIADQAAYKDEEFQTAKRGWATVRAGARRPKAPSKEPHLWVVGEGEVRPWA